jgi:NADH-quinone oxidoreductase subunit A
MRGGTFFRFPYAVSRAVLLYPWAITFKQLGVIGFIEMMIFIGLFVVAYIYAWRKGALEWD